MLVEKIEFGTDEHIVLLVRRHWFVLMSQLSMPAAFALFPVAAAFVLSAAQIPIAIPDLASYTPIIAFAYTAWLLLVWMLAFNIFTNHYLDTMVITNERIVLVDQKGLFFRSVGSFRLERLQDLRVEVDGILATFFDYGTVHAETAGHSEEEFRAYGMPNPGDLKALILKETDVMVDEYRARPRMAGDDV